MSNTPHLLEIYHEGDEPTWAIMHPSNGCPWVYEEQGDGFTLAYHPDCPFEFELEHVGEDAFLEGVPTEPGFYVIEHYVEKGWDRDDVTTGIVIVGRVEDTVRDGLE